MLQQCDGLLKENSLQAIFFTWSFVS